MDDETVDLETITALQGRINSALDRIAAAVAAAAIGGASGDADRDAALAAELEAEREAGTQLAARIAELEAVAAERADAESAQTELAAAQMALAGAQTAQEAAEAKADELAARVEELQAALAAQPAADADADMTASAVAPGEGDDVLRRRAARLRDERNAARAEQDRLADLLDAVDGPVDEPALLAELRALRLANAELRETGEDLRAQIARSGAAPDPDMLNAAVAAELLALKAERAADAAELKDILAQVGQAEAEESNDA